MRLSKLAAIMTVIFAFASLNVQANSTTMTDKALGEKLLNQLWVNMKTSDMKAIEDFTANGFQSVHQYGAIDRAHEIKLIKGLKLGPYKLTDIKITRNGPVIVATYFVSVSETIHQVRLSKKPAARLSVFLKTSSGWKWIAHANLKPMK